jgi:hypothetical protein
MKTLTILFIISFAFLNLFSSCHKPKNEYVEMVFKLPLSITPTKDTVNVGDTLIMEANFSDNLKEEFSGQYYRLQDFGFKTRVGVFKLSDTSLAISQQAGASNSFSFINEIIGITNLGEAFGGISFQYVNNAYKVKTKIVAKQKGTFAIAIFSQLFGKNTQLNFIDLGQTSSGGKKIAVLDNIWYLFNSGNTHFNLYSKNAKVGNISLPDEKNFETEATYSFVVK